MSVSGIPETHIFECPEMFVCGFVVNQNRPISNMPSSGKASSSVLVYQKRTFASEMGVALKRGNPRALTRFTC